jgi:hypothetical protein
MLKMVYKCSSELLKYKCYIYIHIFLGKWSANTYQKFKNDIPKNFLKVDESASAMKCMQSDPNGQGLLHLKHTSVFKRRKTYLMSCQCVKVRLQDPMDRRVSLWKCAIVLHVYSYTDESRIIQPNVSRDIVWVMGFREICSFFTLVSSFIWFSYNVPGSFYLNHKSVYPHT